MNDALIVAAEGQSVQTLQAELEQAFSGIPGLEVTVRPPAEGVRSGTDLAVLLQDPQVIAALAGAIGVLFGVVINNLAALPALIINTRLKRYELSLKEREVRLEEQKWEASQKKPDPQFVARMLPDLLDHRPAETGVLVRTDRGNYQLKKGASPVEVRQFLEMVYVLDEPIHFVGFPRS